MKRKQVRKRRKRVEKTGFEKNLYWQHSSLILFIKLFIKTLVLKPDPRTLQYRIQANLQKRKRQRKRGRRRGSAQLNRLRSRGGIYRVQQLVIWVRADPELGNKAPFSSASVVPVLCAVHLIYFLIRIFIQLNKSKKGQRIKALLFVTSSTADTTRC